MAYYSKVTNVNTIISDACGNDPNGSITGYKGFPISESVPDSYNFMRITQSLGYKKNGVELTKTSNGQSNCNAYSVFYNNTTLTTNDVSNYNYMSCVLVGGGGGGAGGFGSNDGGSGGGGGGAGAYYKVDISSFNNLQIQAGKGGNNGAQGENSNNGGNGNGGSSSIIYLGNTTSYSIKANGGGGGYATPNEDTGGNKGTFGTNNVSSGTIYNFNASGNGGAAGNNGNNDDGGNGGSVGNWTTPLANYYTGTGGNYGKYLNKAAGDGNNYGGGGGGGYGTNNSNVDRNGGNGAPGYVQIWLYRE